MEKRGIFRAFCSCWLLSLLPLMARLEVTFSSLSPSGINYEVVALMTIKVELNDPYNVLENWDMNSVDPCSWRMVTCSPDGILLHAHHSLLGLHGSFEKMEGGKRIGSFDIVSGGIISKTNWDADKISGLMAQAARLNLRMQKEIKLLVSDPPPGVSFPFLSDEDNTFSTLTTIEARLRGPEDTIYCEGLFTLKIQIPERYPFQPPNVCFVTPIYHPNIDNGGRICLDILNLPPKGAWQPSLNISTVLTSIGLLLSDPNPDDGLMAEASREYKYNKKVFDEKARYWTQRYANPVTAGKDIDESKSPKMEAKQHLAHAMNPLSDISNAQKLSDKPVDETVGSRKKMRLMGRKLSLKSVSPCREMSIEDKENTASNQEPFILTGRATDDDEKEASFQALPMTCIDRISVGISNSVVQDPCGELGESGEDISTIIISDSEESDREVDRPYKSRISFMRKGTAS